MHYTKSTTYKRKRVDGDGDNLLKFQKNKIQQLQNDNKVIRILNEYLRDTVTKQNKKIEELRVTVATQDKKK